ncbi:MAG: BCCT family transporter [Sphaerobacteraceae bacterium]|nr:MAG: BCCT family transporter [Sphaerobacteraceae bacterium]
MAVSEENEQQTEQLETWSRFEIRPSVFFPSAAIIIGFVLTGVIFVDEFARAFASAQDFVNTTLGWFYILAVSIFLIFVIFLALSPYGRIRLGPDDARPDFSYAGWFAMMFSAGMGIGLLFFSVAEPISHFAIDSPPATTAELGTEGAAREAMNITFFHWGLHTWAIYIVVGLALCFFAYRKGLPLTMRSAFYPILGDRIRGPIGDAIDTLAIVGTLFGVATSLGLGVVQLNSGLSYTVDIEPSRMVQLLLIAIITAVATVSVVLGLDKGIKRLSEANLTLSGLLVLFILIAGPTVFILRALVENTGYYLQNIIQTSMRTDMFTDPVWQGDWTLFYWGWWISWSPFVGMFIARVSRGRTVREFITGVLLVPTVITFIFLTVFGQTALHMELFGDGGVIGATEESLDFALFAMLEELPLGLITSVIAMIIIAGFFVTSSDSGSLVDDIHASGGNLNPRTPTRIFWAIAEGTVAGVLLMAGGETGVEAFQQASIITGVPIAIMLLLMCWAIFSAFRDDLAESRSRERAGSRAAPRSSQARSRTTDEDGY